jgi:hypothetical protein
MTNEHEASRTLVKSPPELWAECSRAQSLARHLAGSFGEIRITRLEPETAVAWEGEHVSGTVRLEPSGWGTRVTLTAQTPAVERKEAEPEVAEPPIDDEPAPILAAKAEPVIDEEPAPIAPPEPIEGIASQSEPGQAEAPRPRLFERLRAFFRGPEPPTAAEEPEPDVSAETPAAADPAEPAVIEPEPEPDQDPADPPPPDPGAVLTSALDSLGQAHHRPFSRA